MTERSDIEQAVLDEERALEQVARLIEGGVELFTWPEDLATALALALIDPAMSPTESWKAVTLRRHLFGPTDHMVEMVKISHAFGHLDASRVLSTVDRKRAERLRADIPGLIRYRAGRYLLMTPHSARPAAV